MYKLAYVSGSSQDISIHLRRNLEEINGIGGKIEHMMQSQSTTPHGTIVVTVTIIYSIRRSI